MKDAPGPRSAFASWAPVIAAALVGAAAAFGVRHFATGSTFDMMEHINSRITAHEDVGDVRCWSSVSKLQSFLAESAIEPMAQAARVEGHRQVIESIWLDASSASGRKRQIEAAAVDAIIKRRFPYVEDASGALQCRLVSTPDVIQIPSSDVRDYGTTIEPWRLLQSWIMQRVEGQRTPAFSPEALNVLKDFLLVYDLTIMRHAGKLARERQLAAIDERAMRDAFVQAVELKETPGG